MGAIDATKDAYENAIDAFGNPVEDTIEDVIEKAI